MLIIIRVYLDNAAVKGKYDSSKRKRKSTLFNHQNLVKCFYSYINQLPDHHPQRQTPGTKQTCVLHVQPSEWWAALSITEVMACEQPSSVWIGGLLDGVPTQTAGAGLGGTVGQLPSAAAILHAVHTAQSHTLN